MPSDPEYTLASKIVKAIEGDLRGRCGLKQEFERIDEEIREEISNCWINTVKEILSKELSND
jgi:hypothetical protein